MYLVAVVGPGSELHFTVLIVKGEPSDVYLACALEDARRDVQATAVMRDHHVCLERPVETLLRTIHGVIVDILNFNRAVIQVFGFFIYFYFGSFFWLRHSIIFIFFVIFLVSFACFLLTHTQLYTAFSRGAAKLYFIIIMISFEQYVSFFLLLHAFFGLVLGRAYTAHILTFFSRLIDP